MSLSIVRARAVLGVSVLTVTIEIHVSNGLPGLTTVGLPEITVKETRGRVRSVITNSGCEFPVKEVTIDLAPADLPKEGGRYDLPITVALLAASEQPTAHNFDTYELVSELALTGALCGVSDATSSATKAVHAGRRIIVAKENAAEVGLVHGEGCLIADHLQTVYAFLKGKHDLDRPLSAGFTPCALTDDLSDAIGQEQGKRGLGLTAAGGHNLLFIGPPGTGKAMLANRLRELPLPLSNDKVLESAAILSLVNSSTLQKQWRQRPSCSPHHSAPLTATVGGGSIPAPDKVSLTHNGILSLDELPEFKRRTLDALREPIGSRQIYLSRTRAKITYPARFQLIAAVNPSPAGHCQGNHNRCILKQTLHYLNRLSGPLLNRLDLSLEAPIPPPGILSQSQVKGEDNVTVKQRAMAARKRQHQRQNKLNAYLDSQDIHKYCPLRSDDAQWLGETLAHLGLSIRAWLCLMKIVRTIADIEQSDYISRQHLQGVVGYRAIDRLLIHLRKPLV